MPISRDEFHAIDEKAESVPDLSPDTTQGRIYRFLLANADRAFRQREIAEAVDVPKGSVGPTLSRLEERGIVEHRAEYWIVADHEHAVASAGVHGAATADARDDGFSEETIDRWMQSAVDPVPGFADEAPGEGTDDSEVASDRGNGDDAEEA